MVVCPYCEKDIDVPEIVEIDPDAKLPTTSLKCPASWHNGFRHAMVLVKLQGWRKVSDTN